MSGFGGAGAVGSTTATALERTAASNNRGTQVRTPTPQRGHVAIFVSGLAASGVLATVSLILLQGARHLVQEQPLPW